MNEIQRAQAVGAMHVAHMCEGMAGMGIEVQQTLKVVHSAVRQDALSPASSSQGFTLIAALSTTSTSTPTTA